MPGTETVLPRTQALTPQNGARPRRQLEQVQSVSSALAPCSAAVLQLEGLQVADKVVGLREAEVGVYRSGVLPVQACLRRAPEVALSAAQHSLRLSLAIVVPGLTVELDRRCRILGRRVGLAKLEACGERPEQSRALSDGLPAFPAGIERSLVIVDRIGELPVRLMHFADAAECDSLAGPAAGFQAGGGHILQRLS